VISKKAILTWVFSAVVGIGMLASASRALAHDHGNSAGGGSHHQQHRGWYNHQSTNINPSYNQRSYANAYGTGNGYSRPNGAYGYGWNRPNYSYNQPSYNYSQPNYGYYPSNGAGMVNRRNPNLIWVCNSQGHHCHWAQRYGYNSSFSPFAFNGYNNGYENNYGNYGNGYYGSNNGYYNGNNGYYGGNNGYYGANNGSYGNSLGGLGSLLGPLFGGQRP
jgi:hypothetical protein